MANPLHFESDLGALVASPHFRWLPGMLSSTGLRVIKCYQPGKRSWLRWDDGSEGYPDSNESPATDDPSGATNGCLLHLVREAWGPHMSVEVLWIPGRAVRVMIYSPGMHEADRFESLEAALLAAPTKVPS